MDRRHTERQKKLEFLETLCREHGLPLTVQRRVIFNALLDRDDHPTVDQLFQDVKDLVPGVSRTTVYRSLETLVKLGAARKTHHPDATVRFDGNVSRHHHLICRSCNQIFDFNDPGLDKLELPGFKTKGFRVVDYSFQFEGLCSQCQEKGSKPPRKPKGGIKVQDRVRQ